MPEQTKSMVRRLVEAINAGGEPGAVDELFALRAARRVQRLFAEEDTVAGRFRCSGTHLGEFQGEAPTGRRMEVEEVFFLRAKDGRAGLRIPALAGRTSSYLLAGQYRTFLVSHGEG